MSDLPSRAATSASGARLSKLNDVFQEDVADLLRALGLSDHARPASPHAVLQADVKQGILTLRDNLAEAEAYIAALRGPLLEHFGTTDPELLAEVLSARVSAPDVAADAVLEFSLLDDVARAHLSVNTTNALLNRNCRTIEAALLLSEGELWRTNNLGRVGIAQIEALRAWVLDLSNDAPAKRLALIQRMYATADEPNNTTVRFLLGEINRLSGALDEARRNRARLDAELKQEKADHGMTWGCLHMIREELEQVYGVEYMKGVPPMFYNDAIRRAIARAAPSSDSGEVRE